MNTPYTQGCTESGHDALILKDLIFIKLVRNQPETQQTLAFRRKYRLWANDNLADNLAILQHFERFN